jgi:hypothetical protein
MLTRGGCQQWLTAAETGQETLAAAAASNRRQLVTDWEWTPMRRHIARYLSCVAVAALAVGLLSGLLSGCGTQLAPAPRPAAVESHSRPDSFIGQARLVIERWDRSRAARLWDTGLVLTGLEPLIQTPASAGFDSQRQKDMFYSGHFRLATRLPGGLPGNVVRWASGVSMRVPVDDVRGAFAKLATQTPCGGPYACSSLGDLSVVSVRPATVTLPTSRGLAQVPAWQFRVAQLGWPFTAVAVASRALLVWPPAFTTQPESAFGGPSGLVAVSADGRELTLVTGVGYCSGQPVPRVTGLVYESAGAVVVGTQVTSVATGSNGCAGVELLARFRVTLGRPFGHRVLLSVGSGEPVASVGQG